MHSCQARLHPWKKVRHFPALLWHMQAFQWWHSMVKSFGLGQSNTKIKIWLSSNSNLAISRLRVFYQATYLCTHARNATFRLPEFLGASRGFDEMNQNQIQDSTWNRAKSGKLATMQTSSPNDSTFPGLKSNHVVMSQGLKFCIELK